MIRRGLAVLLLLAALLQGARAEETVVVDWINGTPTDFSFAADAPLLEMYFAPVFDADAALLRCGGETIMIDCGSKVMSKRTIGMLRQLGVTEIDAIINTHPHYDHLQALEQIAQVVKVKELRLCFPADETGQAQTAVDFCEKQGIPVTYYADGTRWQLGDAVIDVWLKGREDWSLNNRSAVMRVTYGQRSALFAADAEHELLKLLAETMPAEQLNVDILKYPHHGIQVLQEDFRKAATPLFTVITNQDYERMRNTKARLNRWGIPYAFTLKGPVAVCTDGQTWLVQRLPIDPTTIN